VPRLRRTAVAIASAACMAAAITGAMTAPALAQPAHTTPAAQISLRTLVKSGQIAIVEQGHKLNATAAATATIPCYDSTFSGAAEFWRCTGDSETSTMVGSSCSVSEQNAATYYNVYAALNLCTGRVWLHQNKYTSGTPAGWAVCIAYYGLPEGAYQYWGYNLEPKNIQVSANTAYCTTTLPS
jgi:hypothetical protein